MAALLHLHEEMEIILQRFEEIVNAKLLKVRADLEEGQSRQRLSCTCKDMKRPIYYPLTNRIVEMAYFSPMHVQQYL